MTYGLLNNGNSHDLEWPSRSFIYCKPFQMDSHTVVQHRVSCGSSEISFSTFCRWQHACGALKLVVQCLPQHSNVRHFTTSEWPLEDAKVNIDTEPDELDWEKNENSYQRYAALRAVLRWTFLALHTSCQVVENMHVGHGHAHLELQIVRHHSALEQPLFFATA